MLDVYYNEFDKKKCAGLKALMEDGHISKGEIDDRPIQEVRASDLRGFIQCHFFAGIGLWDYAARLARWPRYRPVWTGSCPCQDFSIAGKEQGFDGERDLWGEWFRLIRECRPPKIYGEQVKNAIKHGWLDRMYAQMEPEDYAIGAAVLPACSVGAPHLRYRLYFVADCNEAREQQSAWHEQESRVGTGGGCEIMADPKDAGFQSASLSGESGGAFGERNAGTGLAGICIGNPNVAHAYGGDGHWWSGPLQVGWNTIQGEITRRGRKQNAQWRVKPGISLLAYGYPERVGLINSAGDAIVPQVAARFIRSAA